MEEIKKELKKGVNVHLIQTDKFKTNLLAVFLTTPMTRENVTYNALIPAVLLRGSKNHKTSEEISKTLEEMYGANIDGGIEKAGDNQVLKFYLESLNEEYLPSPENLLEKTINLLWEVIFNPYTENGVFKEEYVQGEKEKIRQIIDGKIDNKASYSMFRCIEEMYKDKPYGLYKYGYTEDLENIDSKNLYQKYQELIKDCKIDIFLSGKVDKESIAKIEEKVKEIPEREAKYVLTDKEEMQDVKEPKIVEETMDIAQAKLVMGLDVHADEKQDKYVALVYNAIFGGTPTSKLFQNVREKASLAYSASSSYLRQKNNIFIKCGIETKNFEKAKEIIQKQLDDMKQGDFTKEDMESAKRNIISVVKCIPDEQDMEITYYFGQELSSTKMNFDEYAETIEKVTKEQICSLANKVCINTIYFLKGGNK